MNRKVDDIMVTCFEGGSVYWIKNVEIVEDNNGKYLSEVIANGGVLKIVDEDGGEHIITKEKVLKEIQNAERENPHFWNVFDANDADCILQKAVFGEVVYG